jgi:NTE family protein
MNAVVEIAARNKGVGLALSGGGYRASLFHLGSLQRLCSLGALDAVSHFSSVSGGSITSGLIAVDFITQPVSAWQDRLARVGRQLRAFCSHTIDTGTIVGGMLTPFRRVSDVLANKYKDMYGEHRLSELPANGPQFTFCSTNLQTGRLVHLTRGAVIDYRIGRANVDVSLARAVAASSAFPPFLSPVIIDCKGASWTALRHSVHTDDPDYTMKLYLTDGGAYDNMGLEPVWDDYETVLVSDAGAPYTPQEDIDSNWFSQLHCAFEIATDQARGVRKRWLVSQYETGTPAGTYWGINTDILNYQQADALRVAPGTINRLAGMRTRLNAFSPEEQELLINWGYAVTDAALRRWCPALCVTPTAAALPFPNRMLS